MERLSICVGDPPTSGGVALPYASAPMTFMGFQAALIGGKVRCALCESIGHIVKAGGPSRLSFNGAELALEGDLLLCGCVPAPSMMATLQRTSRFDDDRERLGRAPAVHDELVRMQAGGLDVPFLAYRIETQDGRVFEGLTDREGKLPRVATAQGQAFKVFLGDEALARKDLPQ